MGARLKFWRRSRVPKKGSRDEADYKGSAACRKCRRAVLHGITVLKQNRVYFTASILTVQWLAHTLHKIVFASAVLDGTGVVNTNNLKG